MISSYMTLDISQTSASTLSLSGIYYKQKLKRLENWIPSLWHTVWQQWYTSAFYHWFLRPEYVHFESISHPFPCPRDDRLQESPLPTWSPFKRGCCHIPEFDQVQSWPWTTSDHLVHLGPSNFSLISDYSVHSWYPDLSPTWMAWAIWPLGLYDLIWTIPFRLNHLIISVAYLPPFVLGSPLESSVDATQTFRYCPPCIHPRSCTLPRLGLVPFPSMPLLAFGHCLVTILYIPIHCSCSPLVWISRL